MRQRTAWHGEVFISEQQLEHEQFSERVTCNGFVDTPRKESLPSREDSQASLDEFWERARRGKQSCVDCGAERAKWASISYGCFLCYECSGRHRGLGPHMSRVKGIILDGWSPEEKRRMELGGNEKLEKFFANYPSLAYPCFRAPTDDEVRVRYGSLAGDFYRRQLDTAWKGLDFREAAPAASQGNMPWEPCRAKEKDFDSSSQSDRTWSQSEPAKEKLSKVSRWESLLLDRDALRASASSEQWSVVGKPVEEMQGGFMPL